MKTTFKLLLFSVFVVFSNSLFSQDSRFIEVTAVDTINLKPTEFTYQITIKGNKGVRGLPYYLAKDTTPSVSALYVENLLKTNQFKWKIYEHFDYLFFNRFDKDTNILVVLNNEQELNKFYNLFSPLKGINIKMYELEYEPLSTYMNDLYKNLYQQALANATLLAKMVGNTIGKLISVEEIKEENSNILNYEQNNIRESLDSKKRQSMDKIIVKKMSFRFQMQ